MKIKKRKYYIVDNINLLNPKLFRKAFDSKQFSKKVIRKYLDANFKRFTIIKGRYAIKNKIGFIPHKEGRKFKERIVKYEYDKECITNQDRKSFRTKLRRDEKIKKAFNKRWFTIT